MGRDALPRPPPGPLWPHPRRRDLVRFLAAGARLLGIHFAWAVLAFAGAKKSTHVRDVGGGHVKIAEVGKTLVESDLATAMEDTSEKWTEHPQYEKWMTHSEMADLVRTSEGRQTQGKVRP